MSNAAMILRPKTSTRIGGVKSLSGAPIELVYADNQGKQEVAIGGIRTPHTGREKVAAIMGSWHSATTIAGTQAGERLKTPWVIEVSSANIILERGFKYVARVNVKASWYGEAPVDFLDYAKSSLHQDVKRVAIMYVDNDWGRASVGKGTKEALQKHGYEIVADLAYPSASQAVTSYINQIKAAKPDAVIVTSFPNDALLVGRTMEQLGVKVPIAVGVSSGYVLPTFRSTLGPAADRWFVVGGWKSRHPRREGLS